MALALGAVGASGGGTESVFGAFFHLDGSPKRTATLTFAVPRLGTGETATLRLYAESASRTGYVVSVAASSARSAAFAAHSWTRVDVTRLVARGGKASLVLEDASSGAIRLAGLASPNPPALVLQRRGAVIRLLAPAGAPRPAGPVAAGGPAEQGLLVPGKTAVIAAAGDIACDPADTAFGGKSPGRCQETATSNLLLGIPHLAAVLTLGDDQYECGRSHAFAQSYAPSWGRLLRITHPVPGNHEYGRACQTNDPTPYFSYFGKAAGPSGKGWYSYDIARWHLVALNSECSYGVGADAVGGCGPGSPEERWLRRDLAAHRNACTLAYWHEPRFSSGEHGDAVQMSTIWNDLVKAHADIVMSGHNHDYERFAPIGATPAPPSRVNATTTGAPVYQQPRLDPAGIREFVAGTGGKNLYRFEPSHSAAPTAPLTGEQVRNDTVFGVLELTLLPKSYAWKFVTTAHRVLDHGTGSCH